MADFKTAYTKYIQPNEGGYANVSQDKGGETYAGISRINYPKWNGWTAIDIKKNRYANGIIPHNTLFNDVQFLVEQFYQGLWDTNRMGEIKNQDVANLLFDFYVNSDRIAFKKIQSLVKVPADGAIGPQSIAAINAADPAKLYADLKKVREDFYKTIVAKNPEQQKFLKGWMNRLSSFPAFISSNALPIAGIIGVLVIIGIAVYVNHEPKKKQVSESRG